MLPISELVRFGALLDADWHSPVADAAAVRWAAERPVFLRSSASHVLVARRPVGPRVVLRLRPDERTGEGGATEVLGRGARVARDWRAAGGPVAGPVPSEDGQLVEHVDGYAVTALEAVAGEPLDDEDLAPAAAHEWGSTVARAHEAGHDVDRAGLPTTESLLDVEVTGVPAPLGRARADVLAALVRLPRDPAVHGLLHGDPEPDNVVAGPAGHLLVDPDEVRLGWFVSDVGFALRAWASADDPCAVPDLAAPVPAAFVAGYRSVRPLTDEELGWLPLMARAAAWEDWHALQVHVRESVDPAWPDWARALDSRIRSRVVRLTTSLQR